AGRLGVTVRRKEAKSLTGMAIYRGKRLLLVKPLTFMNESGQAVRLLLDYYNVPTERLLVIYDDLDLLPGRIRLRAKGSAGGHNGMRSIIKYLGTESFPRLRIGIGPVPAGMSGMNYVLSPFRNEEAALMAEVFTAASEAALLWLDSGVEKAMSLVNGSAAAGDNGK
ncbi:MAG TPA: aminoacyl-tRNA hydrolase, partial [Firmicutes bacterium]|nr:aminoacyl-tRNA hydrolase [Bacillota bacterium]